MAAIEDEHQALRRAAIHPGRHVRRFDGGAREHRPLGVAHGQVEVPLLVAHAVAGEIEHQEIVAMLGIEEPGDRLANGGQSFVQEWRDLVEAPDAWRLQDLDECAHVDIRRSQSREPGIFVLAVADDERELARHSGSRVIGAERRTAASVWPSFFE